MHEKFQDRIQAGIKLAKALSEYSGKKGTLILALPRGGVPVAFEVAQKLNLPMDVLLVRKLGVPGHEELAMGAIASGNIRFINNDLVEQLDIPNYIIDRVIKKEQQELARRNKAYRDDLPFPKLDGKTVIVIDDGLATGATMKAAISTIRQTKAKRIIVAVPVGAASTYSELKCIADNVICLHMPEPFYGVGQWYIDFSQTTDEEVQNLLAISRRDFYNKKKVNEYD